MKNSFEKWIEFEENKNNKNEPIQRYYHSSILEKDSIFIFGGCYYEYSLNDLFEYKIKENKWIKYQYQNNEPPNMIQMSMNYYDSKLFIIGGRDNCYISSTPYSSLWIFHLNNSKWIEYKNILKIYLHSSIQIEDSIYIFGGFDGEKLLNNFIQINLNNLKIKNIDHHFISNRYRSLLSKDNDHIYIFGGNNLIQDLNDLYSFNIKNYSFKKIEYEFIPRLKYNSFFIIEKKFIFISNSNIYILENEKLKNINLDHSLVQSNVHYYNSILFYILGKNSLVAINKFSLDIYNQSFF